MTSNNNLTGGFTQPGRSATIKSYTQDTPQFWKYKKGLSAGASELTPTTSNAKVLINNDLTVHGNIYLSGEILPSTINLNQYLEQIPLLVDQIQRMQNEIDLLKSQSK
jgi:hypothetical protein